MDPIIAFAATFTLVPGFLAIGALLDVRLRQVTADELNAAEALDR